MINTLKHFRTVERALMWLDKIYPSDVFDGSSGVKIVDDDIEDDIEARNKF